MCTVLAGSLGGGGAVTLRKHDVVLWRFGVSSWVNGISEGGRNFFPNLVSDLESGPRKF